jgi:hypothetical protein
MARRWPVQGGPGDVHQRCQVRRPWGCASGVWSWRRGTVGTHWRAHASRHRAGRQRERRGGPGGFFPFLPCLTAWVGAKEAEARPRGVHKHGYRARANGNSVGHSGFDFPGFRPPTVRSNARKNSKFKFLKRFTLGCQHIKQGFQRYFY